MLPLPVSRLTYEMLRVTLGPWARLWVVPVSVPQKQSYDHRKD